MEEAIPVIIMYEGRTKVADNTAPCQPLFDMSLIVGAGNLKGNTKYTVLVQIDWNKGHLSSIENGSFMLKVSSPCGFSLSEEKRGY